MRLSRFISALFCALLALALPARADLLTIGYQQALSHNWLNGLLQSTDLVTDLRTFTGLTGASTNGTGPIDTMVYVRGLASVGDGFGGTFYWNALSTASDDGATVIQPTGLSGPGRWLLLSNSRYAPATTGTALLKGNGTGGFSAAAAGTDYAPATSGTAIQKGNGSGGFSPAVSGTDYAPAPSGSSALKGNGLGGFTPAGVGDLAAIAANTLVGNPTGSSAAPTAISVPGCSNSSGNHLNWTAGTGFSCGNTTNASAVGLAPQGRLTLQSGVPVMVTSQTGKTTIFYDNYVGNMIPVWNGTADVLLTITGGEISLALSSVEEGAGHVFDVFAVNVSGVATLCTATNNGGSSGEGWAGDTGGSDTARGTGYSQIDRQTRPYATNKNSIPHCYAGTTDLGAIVANRATFLGTYETTSAGQTSWRYGVNGAPPTEAFFFLWNMYNRVLVSTMLGETTATWTYASMTVHEINGDSAAAVAFVTGLQEDAFDATYQSWGIGGGTSVPLVGVGLDTLTAFSGIVGGGTNAAAVNPMSGRWTGTVLGAHQLSALEALANGSTAANFYGATSLLNSNQGNDLIFSGRF